MLVWDFGFHWFAYRVIGFQSVNHWTPQTDKINAFIVLQAVRSGNMDIYDGKPFAFCPWCGNKRPEKTVINP